MTSIAAPLRGTLRPQAVRRLVRDWYSALDRHAGADELLGFVTGAGLRLEFPGFTVRSHHDLRAWCGEITRAHFDQERTPVSMTVRTISPLHADVAVQLHWQSRLWLPPAPRSRWTGCRVTETWTVVLQDGRPRIRTLRTDTLTLLPGAAPLPDPFPRRRTDPVPPETRRPWSLRPSTAR